MAYLKVSILFCIVALLVAVIANLSFLLGSRLFGGAAISATRLGWTLLFGTWWASSFLLGVRLAVALQVFPFLPRS